MLNRTNLTPREYDFPRSMPANNPSVANRPEFNYTWGASRLRPGVVSAQAILASIEGDN